MAKSKLKTSATGPDRYLELVQELPLRPIRSEAELDRAIVMVNGLIDRETRTPEEEDYLDVLSDLIEKYESAAHQIAPASDAEIFQHLIEAKGVTQAKVAEETGMARSTISEILSGKRTLTRRHLDILAHYFHVSPAVFLGG